MRLRLIVLVMLLCAATAATAQVNISINVSLFPELVQVPGYPVYYAPRQSSNYFFYDGLYWVYQDDDWYSSAWYNGPWRRADPEFVPVYLLRVPVRYYRRPPAYFHGWRRDAPPRWGEHWGHEWEQHRSGWDRWNRRAAPAPAPLPVYQRRYSGNRYPQVEQQRALINQNYRYRPKDALVREHFQQHASASPAPAREKPAEVRREQSAPRPTAQPQRPPQAVSPHEQPPAKAAPPAPAREKHPEVRREQPAPRPMVHSQQPRPQAESPREQPSVKSAAPAQRPARQSETPREQPTAKSQGKGPAREPAAEPKRGREDGREDRSQDNQPQKAREQAEKGAQKGRDGTDERGHQSGK